MHIYAILCIFLNHICSNFFKKKLLWQLFSKKKENADDATNFAMDFMAFSKVFKATFS